jgi:HSP20 family protein
MVDMMDRGEVIKVIADLPGAEKENIRLAIRGRTLIISVEGTRCKCRRRVGLTATVDPVHSTSTLRNGVLEVTLKKSKQAVEGPDIRVE